MSLLVTDQFLIMVKKEKEKSSLEWFEPLLRLRRVVSEKDIVRVEFNDPVKSAPRVHTMTCYLQDTRKWLESVIDHASHLAEVKEKMQSMPLEEDE